MVVRFFSILSLVTIWSFLMPYFSVFSPLCLAIVSKSSLMEMSCGNFKYISPVEWLILDLIKEVSTMHFEFAAKKND